MLVKEADLTRRFARYTVGELTQALVSGLTLYTHEELAAAEKELSRRPPQPAPAPEDAPLWPPKVEPRAVNRRREARPKSPYDVVDLLADMLLIGFVIWAMKKLEDWTFVPMGEVLGLVVYLVLVSALLSSAVSLRQRWRARGWEDWPARRGSRPLD